MKIIRDILWFICLCIFAFFMFIVGQNKERSETAVNEQHESCRDTKEREAWIARKGGFVSCFEEHREYPHRVRSSHIE